jgi:hypothetical protein
MRRPFLVTLALLVPVGQTLAAEIDAKLEPLRPFVGKTWRGDLSKAGAAKPTIDVQRWELVLNGQAVRVLHSLNDGEYGGESLTIWDKQRGTLAYWYFTTAGFYTTGTFEVADGALVSRETVKGNADGITEVKGVSRLLPDGRMHVKTQYLKGGQWVDGRDSYYAPDAKAEVRFK